MQRRQTEEQCSKALQAVDQMNLVLATEAGVQGGEDGGEGSLRHSFERLAEDNRTSEVGCSGAGVHGSGRGPTAPTGPKP